MRLTNTPLKTFAVFSPANRVLAELKVDVDGDCFLIEASQKTVNKMEFKVYNLYYLDNVFMKATVYQTEAEIGVLAFSKMPDTKKMAWLEAIFAEATASKKVG